MYDDKYSAGTLYVKGLKYVAFFFFPPLTKEFIAMIPELLLIFQSFQHIQIKSLTI